MSYKKTFWERLFGIHVCEVDGCEYNQDEVNEIMLSAYKSIFDKTIIKPHPNCIYCGRKYPAGFNKAKT